VTAGFPPITKLLPHRPPMLLIDAVVEGDETHTVATASIGPTSTFVQNGQLPAIVLVEYMAQCVAAFVGLDDLRNGRPVQVGFLLACRTASFEVESVVPGDDLRIEAKLLWMEGGMGRFDCHVERRGETIARANISVLQGALPTENS